MPALGDRCELMTACVCGSQQRTRADRAFDEPAIRSSAERSGNSTEIASISTSSKPASPSKAANTTSSANWKNDGPAGRPVGGGTFASVTAPRIVANNGERPGGVPRRERDASA